MWVHEEEVNGRKLTEIINSDHENVKYLQGVELPHNLLLDLICDSFLDPCICDTQPFNSPWMSCVNRFY